MQKFKLISLLLSLSLGMFSCNQANEEGSSLQVVNSLNSVQKEVLVSLDLKQLTKTDITEKMVVVVANGIVPSQLIDSDFDNVFDHLLVLLDFEPSETLNLKIRAIKHNEQVPNFKKRTHAEISIKEGGTWEWLTKKNGNEQYEYKGGTFKNVSSLIVPKQHTDHSFYIKYEGPGWESDKVAYRFYLDWRNAVDIFGKKISDIVLPQVGLDGFDSYHEEADWGMDILKVGSSLGMGSIGYFDGDKAIRVAKTDSLACAILQDGMIQSSFKTNYYGWNYAEELTTDLTLFTTINAGSRLTFQTLEFNQAPKNICTGIVKHDGARFFKSELPNSTWNYIATFGLQSLNNDNMGMVVFYKNDQLIDLTEDKKSYIVVLKPTDNKASYCFAATWEKDMDKINTVEKFTAYLNQTLESLNNRPTVVYGK